MTHDTMAYVSIAMFAMLFYRFSYIRFLAPMWVILFVITTDRAVTTYGLVTILMFAVVLMFFVLDEIRTAQKKAAKNRSKDQDDDVVSIFEEDEDDENSDLPRMYALRDDESPKKSAKPKKSQLTIYEGSLLDHGIAPYKDDANNDRSYFVDCDGKKVWGFGLQDAIQKCGAEIGDKIRFWKKAEMRTSKARVLDSNGEVTGYRNLSQDKRRGIWVMEIVSD
ncbi:hypothetical protein [Xenorhabdus sp. KJ12.1]|uniref:hypothetical protein n=1 Tax=Xenorhabdus sp. KJ12.1 TaxID=1851571 RepID=UPI000C044A0B|nr:hypothetical protein [Xenorhabdus sp. KJ12.1]PHM72199.1 MobB relaxase/mobilization protein [Xenorhabdus sp. KJ12.1]